VSSVDPVASLQRKGLYHFCPILFAASIIHVECPLLSPPFLTQFPFPLLVSSFFSCHVHCIRSSHSFCIRTFATAAAWMCAQTMKGILSSQKETNTMSERRPQPHPNPAGHHQMPSLAVAAVVAAAVLARHQQHLHLVPQFEIWGSRWIWLPVITTRARMRLCF
jgi:hypothetical protein